MGANTHRPSHVDTGTDLDPEAIQTEVSEVQAEIDRFSTIRKKTTSIKNTANEIDEQLDEIGGEVKTRLTDIRTELRSGSDT